MKREDELCTGRVEREKERTALRKRETEKKTDNETQSCTGMEWNGMVFGEHKEMKEKTWNQSKLRFEFGL